MNCARQEFVITFLTQILSDPDSLVLFAGVYPIYFGFHRMLSKRVLFRPQPINNAAPTSSFLGQLRDHASDSTAGRPKHGHVLNLSPDVVF